MSPLCYAFATASRSHSIPQQSAGRDRPVAAISFETICHSGSCEDVSAVPGVRKRVPCLCSCSLDADSLTSHSPPAISPVEAYPARSPVNPGVYILNNRDQEQRRCWSLGHRMAEIAFPKKSQENRDRPLIKGP